VSSKEVLEEMREISKNLMQLDQRIETRAGTLITVSGTLSGILFVFGGYLLSNVDPTYYLRNYMYFAFASSIFTALISLLWSLLLAYSQRRFSFVSPEALIRYKQVSDENRPAPSPESRPEGSGENSAVEDVRNRLINRYADMNDDNNFLISHKAFRLQVSQWWRSK
jgi:hypothetical protein